MKVCFQWGKKKMSFITIIIIIMCSSQTNVQFPNFLEEKFNYFPGKKTNGDFSGVSRVLYRWTWAVMFQSPVLNSAAKVALIRLFASWQHLSALEEGCQTALEHFQSSLSQQMELQTICGQTTGPPVVPHCGSYFVTLSNIVGLMFYFFFFFHSFQCFLSATLRPITFGINTVLKAIKSQEKKTKPRCWSKSADLFFFPASNPVCSSDTAIKGMMYGFLFRIQIHITHRKGTPNSGETFMYFNILMLSICSETGAADSWSRPSSNTEKLINTDI